MSVFHFFICSLVWAFTSIALWKLSDIIAYKIESLIRRINKHDKD